MVIEWPCPQFVGYGMGCRPICPASTLVYIDLKGSLATPNSSQGPRGRVVLVVSTSF